MLWTAMYFMYQIFDKVTTTELSDKSAIGHTSLIHYYLLKSGYTWYQKWMNASPTYAEDKRSIEDLRAKINSIVSLPYDTFLAKTKMADSPSLQRLYSRSQNSLTWQALFESISNDQSLRSGFMKAVPHIFRMLKLPNMIATSWTIKKCKVLEQMRKSMSILSIEEVKHTGGHHGVVTRSPRDVLSKVVCMYDGSFSHNIRTGRPLPSF